MTAVDENGDVYSHLHGYAAPTNAKWFYAAFASLSALFLYLALTTGPRAKLPALPVLALPAHMEAGQASSTLPPSSEDATAFVSPALGTPTPHVESSSSWDALLHLCGGDAVRARAIVSGEIALDPHLEGDQSQATTRALARMVLASAARDLAHTGVS